MEGVGARLGRSSSRYGTTTVFSGPVRKWKKDWVSIPPSASSSSSSSNQIHHHLHHLPSSSSLPNGTASTNGAVSHLRLFKWTPLSQTPTTNNKDNSSMNNGNIDNAANDDSPSKDFDAEPPRRKFKYIPVWCCSMLLGSITGTCEIFWLVMPWPLIAALVEQKRGAEENTDDEAKSDDADETTAELASKSDGHDEKPDINDVPMEDNEENEEGNRTAPEWQDLNKSLDLSLG